MTGVQTCALPICFPVTITVDAYIMAEIARAIHNYNNLAVYGGLREYQQEVIDTILNPKPKPKKARKKK